MVILMLKKRASIIAAAACIALVPLQDAHADWATAIARQAAKQAGKHAADQAMKGVQSKTDRFEGYSCLTDCSGHKAGYEWAEANGVYDRSQCTSESKSFYEGCYGFVKSLNTNEIEKRERIYNAASDIISIIKKSGISGVSLYVEYCYRTHDDALYCMYSDVAGKYLDDSVSSMGYPQYSYYDDAKFKIRLSAVLSGRLKSVSDFNRYISAVRRDMSDAIDRMYN